MDKKRKNSPSDTPSGIPAAEESVSASADWKEISGVMDWVEREIENGPMEKARTGDVAAPAMTLPVGEGDDLDLIVKKALVYVVDDDLLLKKMISMLISSEGFENVKAFSDGQEVMEEMYDKKGYLKELPDVIVSDTRMPRMGGHALYEKIAAIRESVRPLFFALSGDEDAKKDWGDVPFIKKPFYPNELIGEITAGLKKSRRFLKN